jgi:hypothetical protein
VSEPVAPIETSLFNWNNITTGVMFGLAALGWIAQRFFKGFDDHKENVEKHERTIVDTDGLTDWSFKNATDNQTAFLKRIAENTDVLVGLEKKRIESEELNRVRAEERLRVQDENYRMEVQDRLNRLDHKDRQTR